MEQIVYAQTFLGSQDHIKILSRLREKRLAALALPKVVSLRLSREHSLTL